MGTFTRYNTSDIVINTDKIVTSTWSNNTNNLSAFYTASTQADRTDPTSQGNFFINVYNEPTGSTSASVQFSVGYGHRRGSSSVDFTNDTGSFGYSATKAVYSQYRQLVYGDETQDFKFDDISPDGLYVLNINRGRYKQNLKPGSLNLWLTSASYTTHLTDDSVTNTGSATITNLGRQFNIVSGVNGERLGSSLTQITNSGSFGLFYPDAGILLLNPNPLGEVMPSLLPAASQNTDDNNHTKLLQHMENGAHFILDSEERISSQYYFTRARNTEFNYTTNPSFIDSNGNLLFTTMIDMPKVFITTVGLYNDDGTLLAVAKLSQPLSKDFTKETLIRVKLDY